MPNPESPETTTTATAAPTAPAAADTASSVPSGGPISTAMDADAAFDAVFGKDDAEPAKAKPEVQTDAAKPEAKTEEALAAPAQVKDGPSVKAEEIAAAVKALRRDNVPDELIENWQRNDPKKLVAWGKAASKRQADGDAYSGKMSQLERKLAEYETKMAEQGQQPKEEDEGDFKEIADQLSPEIADRLKKIIGKTTRTAKSELAEMREQLARVSGFSENLLVEQARADLLKTNRFPELADPDFFEAVKAQMSAQIKRGDYQDPKKLIRDCVVLMRGDDYREQAINELNSDRRIRTAAQPSIPTTREQPKARTHEELEDEAIDMALDGKPIEDIKRHLAGAHR